jgi:hypothetical protein
MKRNVLMTVLSFLIIAILLIPASIAFAQDNNILSEGEIGESIRSLHSTPPAYHETFREDAGLWELDDTDEYSLRYAAGAYWVNALADNIFAWGVGPQRVEDFYLEVDVFFIDGPETNEFGVVFRQVDNENFYGFSIDSSGSYALRKLSAGEWSDVVAWTESDAIRTDTGAVNRLGVYAQGPRITLLINDEVVAHAEDSEFDSGLIGLAAGTFDDPNLEVAYDDLKVWDLQAGSPPLPTPEITPEPTPIDVSGRLEEIRANPPDLSEEFRRNTGTWALESDENVTYDIAGREFTILVNKADWIGWSVHNELAANNLLVEADTTLASGPANSEYGLLFRYQDNQNFYFFAISPGNSSYSLWKNIDGQWSVITPWTTNEAIDASDGAINRVSVLAEGAQITALVNDQAVLQVTDDSFEGGGLALTVGTFDDPGAEVVFDNVDAWVLSAAPAPVETLEPFDTPEPLEPPVETPIISVDERLVEIHEDPATVTSEFRRDDGAWSLDTDENVTHFYARRAFHIRIDQDNWVSWSLHSTLSPADFLAEVDAAHIEGPLDGEYGLVFRFVDEGNFYFYAINANGYYSLWKQVDGAWENMIDWTQSDVLNSGAGSSNRLGILAEGDQITLIANNVGLQQMTDASHSEGQIGLIVGSFNEGGLEIAFDNFALWDLNQ